MAYLEFNKKELVNLEYSLKREYLSTNHAGGYLNTTISGCNTRKYHGLLVLPIDNFGGERHVLLSSLDETLIQHGKEFNLGIHCYGEVYEPRGHKYIVNLEVDKVVAVTYAVGGMVLRKVMMLCNSEDQMFVSYTLLEAKSPTTLRLKPYLAFRNIHALSKANTDANTRHNKIKKGVSYKLYNGYPDLNLQLNVNSEFISCPDWYYNIEYKEESRRMYESREDLFVPGFFELPIKKGQTILFSASVKEEDPSGFKTKFARNMAAKDHRNSFLSCLKISADQFITRRGGECRIYAGYPWLTHNLRDTLLSLPGLTLYDNKDIKSYKDAITTLVKENNDCFGQRYHQADTPLWLFWTLQQYVLATGDYTYIKKNLYKFLKEILYSYKNGIRQNIIMHENGLLWAEERGYALTWMDAYAFGEPITERSGYQVEVNALWYNAICFAIELATAPAESDFAMEFTDLKHKIEKNFKKAFKIEDKDHLADYVGPEGQNKFVRPNQLFVCSFEYSPLTEEEQSVVLKIVEKELLTIRGIRTLSPKNPLYKGEYDGDQLSRDMAYHQGTARIWLLQHFIYASFKLYGTAFLNKAENLIASFEEEISLHCIGSLSEVFDGDPPHQPHGATSYAASVAAVLASLSLIQEYKKEKV